MRRAVAAVATIGMVTLGSPALAHDTGMAINPDETTAIELQSDNVTLVAHHYFPEGTDMMFQRREGKQLYNGVEVDETRDFVFVGGDAKSAADAGGVHIFDITDPELPVHIADIQCRGYHADIAVYENYLIQANDSGGSNAEDCVDDAKKTYDPNNLSQTGTGLRIFDITDPANPEVVAFINAEEGIGPNGSHNITVVPWAGLLYLAQAGFTPDGDFTIVDLKDPTFPVTTIPMQTVAPGSADLCHDIGLDPERELAYCAAIGTTQVLDISDPMNPSLVTTIRSDTISIHHSARLAADGTTLIVGDEHAGAADVNAPDLPNQADNGLGANGCIGSPTVGALFFYDLSVSVQAPLNLGSYAPTFVQPTASPCTSHFYNSVPDSTMIAAGWYEAGILVADHSQPWPLNEVAVFLPELGNFWSAYWWHGYIYGASRTVESKGFGGGLWVIKVDGIDDDREPIASDEGIVWARWTSQLDGGDGGVSEPAPDPDLTVEPAPEPEVEPTGEELPATGGGYALLSLVLGGLYLVLRWRDGVAPGRS